MRDEKEQRIRRLLLAALLGMAIYGWGMVGLGLPVLLFGTFALTDVIDFAATAGCVALTTGILWALWFLAKHGRLRLASIGLLALLLVVNTLFAAVFRGILDTQVSVYSLAVILAGLLLGEQASLVIGGLSILAITALFLGQTTGFLHGRAGPPVFYELAVLIGDLAILSLLLRYAIRLINRGEQVLEAKVEARTRDLQQARQALADAYRRLLVAREEERRQLAHDLHDGAIQQLLGATYRLHSLQGDSSETAGTQTDASGYLEAVRHEILAVVEDLRGLIGELRPPVLDELGLSAAVEAYVGRLDSKGMPEMAVDLDPIGTEEMPETVAISLFRIAQEALRNALRHAGARHVWLSLRSHGGTVTLSVRDDGCGFDVPTQLNALARAGHFGLVGIGERAESVGGRLSIQSKAGYTEIRVSIPLTR